MTGLLAIVLAVQQPQVSASVDRVTALVGDLVTLSIRVEARGGDPIRVLDPVLSGFDVRGTSEATQVRIVDGAPWRTYTRELRLVATRAGTASIGPVRVRHGEDMSETAPITVTVTVPAGGVGPMLAPTIRSLVDTVRAPPGGDEVVLRVVAIPRQLILGAQLDLMTLAWFRRDVRRQLRTPPTLTPPEVEGVWSYRQETPTGIVASRRSGEWWYDLFISHQVLFPLAAGELRVGPATVSYVVPLTYSFLSRELQHEVQSERLAIAVRPQPVAGRPPNFSGVAGSDIAIDFTLQPTQLQAGGAATATVTLDGAGNVALWPEPKVNWPIGVRVYPTDVTVDLTSRDGRIAGRKRFTYLIVVDSAGTHPIPAVTYSYFDAGRGRYRTVGAAGTQLIASIGDMPVATRPPPPPLMLDAGETWSTRLDHVPVVIWVAIAMLPPFLVLIPVASRRMRPRVAVTHAVVRHGGTTLELLDHELRAALAAIVPGAAHRHGADLIAALRAAGLEPPLAAHVVRARDRLYQAVFGPAGGTDPDELGAEVREILRALAGEAAPRHRRRLVPIALVALAWGTPAQAQQSEPERLYEAGAVRPAAEAFLARTAAEPRSPAHWYNLGNSFYRLGEDGRALAAWLRAARLAPRRSEIRRALELLPEDPVTERIARVRYVTAGELLGTAAVLWVGGWLLLGVGRARRFAWGVVVVAAAVAGAGARVRVEARRHIAIVLAHDVPLRSAPFGSAEAARVIVEGSAVTVDRRDGSWLLVARGDVHGWVHEDEVTGL